MAQVVFFRKIILSYHSVFDMARRNFRTTASQFTVHTVQTGGALMLQGTSGTARAGIGVFVGYRDPENMAMPIANVPAHQSPTAIKEKAIMLGILVGTRKIVTKDDTVVVVSDSIEAVERLREKFSTPNVEIRCVPRKYITQAARLARRAC